MKKIFIVGVLLFMTGIYHQEVSGDYTTYQEITVKHPGAKLLSQYASSDYEDYYDEISKRRFWGWRTMTVYKNEPVYYTKETLYVIINDGTSPIKEKITFEREETSTKQYSASGSIGIETDGKVKGFKLNLEGKIDFEASTESKTNTSEKYQLEIEIDPQTKLEIKIIGEGKITNGVARYFRFWFEAKKGGFEIFVVTTEYYSLVKSPIDES